VFWFSLKVLYLFIHPYTNKQHFHLFRTLRFSIKVLYFSLTHKQEPYKKNSLRHFRFSTKSYTHGPTNIIEHQYLLSNLIQILLKVLYFLVLKEQNRTLVRVITRHQILLKVLYFTSHISKHNKTLRNDSSPDSPSKSYTYLNSWSTKIIHSISNKHQILPQSPIL
jgi:hypothetical protein